MPDPLPPPDARALPDLLVTGTDTGIGKTIIAAALVKALRARGVRALGFKPLETGFTASSGSPARSGATPPPGQATLAPALDSELLARASGETTPLAAPLLQLAEPLAPAVAAERAGTAVRPELIEARIDLIRRAGYTLVVEGAGGVMVPLVFHRPHAPLPIAWPFYTVLDLAAHRGLHAIVVGRPGLGTLNHVALTVAMLRSRNIPVKAVILNGRRPAPLALSPEPDLAESTNPSALARMLPDVLIIQVPLHDLARSPAGALATIDALAIIDATVPFLRQLFL
ncbi:MAG TPA: dethiobiotin synthase [Vicinamibacterales bacterium]|nr:dethiobiotin synthase [Vicinamibacterales bacterium]